MIYLASPYWHENPQVRNLRVEKTLLIARALLRRKFPVFSPIIHGHALSEGMLITPTQISEHFADTNLFPFKSADIGFSHEDWLTIDLQILGRCASMLVLQLQGWDISKGVAQEIEFCRKHGIPLSFMAHQDCNILAGLELDILSNQRN